MTVFLPLWAWISIAIMLPLSLLFAFGLGRAYGTDDGIDWMKREAVGAGVAKACDFDGGWRWYTREEIVTRVTRPWPERR
jgi:hypothetical protein